MANSRSVSSTVASEEQWKVILRWVLQSVIALFGVAVVVLGAVAITGMANVNAGFMVFGATIVLEAVYFMIRRIPRFPEAGEKKRKAEHESIDTVVIFAIAGLGVIAAIIVFAVI